MSRKNKRSVNTKSSAAVTTQAAPVGKTTAFNPDYTPVVKDLRRIGMLAGSFIVVLVVLTFFLR
jgi:hypothetical protein